MSINFLDFFKKKKNIVTNVKLDHNLILKLVFELKKYLLKKDIFYDITTNEFRISKKNTKYTYTVETLLKLLLQLRHFPVVIEDEQILFSFFDDVDWKIIITESLTLEERELYYLYKKFYIKKIICFLFIESEFPLVAPNYQSNLYVEFNDMLISLYNYEYVDFTNDYLNTVERKNLACFWYCRFDFAIAKLPIYFIYLLTNISANSYMYNFLLNFFLGFVRYYFGFLFYNKDIIDIRQIDIKKEVDNIIIVLTKNLKEKINSFSLVITDETFNNLISTVNILISMLLSIIINSIYFNNECNSDNQFKSKLNFNNTPHLSNKEDNENIDIFINFIKKIIIYADNNKDFDINKFKSDDFYPFLFNIINILHDKNQSNSQFIFKFIEHLKNNYLNPLLNLKIILKSKEIVHIFDEYNNIFGKDESIFFMAYSVAGYHNLITTSENFSKNLEIEYYDFFLEYFKNS